MLSARRNGSGIKRFALWQARQLTATGMWAAMWECTPSVTTALISTMLMKMLLKIVAVMKNLTARITPSD
jgi:hypothetical protein